MNRHTFARSLVVLLLTTLLLTGCSNLQKMFFKESQGLNQVDGLLGRIERVHVESELSKERVRETMDALEAITDPEFAGDALSAYGEFVDAIEQSEEQARKLRSSARPMKATAKELFASWVKDLQEFSSGDMRQRSQARLERTRERYEAILASLEPSQWSYDAFNRGMKDHALFLSNDLNATSLVEIQEGVGELTQMARELDGRLDACLVAAEEYIRMAALPGHLEPAAAEVGSSTSMGGTARAARSAHGGSRN